MEARSLEAIFSALNTARVRYLVAGGLAVVKHGYRRFTGDVDLVLDLEQDNLKRAIAALSGLGYRPRVPVAFEALADPAAREAWVRDKDMTVLGLFSDEHRLTDLDIFVTNPIRFDVALSRSVSDELAPGVPAIFVGIEDLLEMKRIAGRPKDLLDIEQLERVRKLGSRQGGA